MTSGQKEVDIQALAKLARIEVSAEDLKTLEEQIPSILSFVARIQEVSDTALSDTDMPEQHTVMREDDNPHEAGAYSETLLDAAPKRKGNHVVVPQVIKGGKHV
jgi:aspartyl/glutamyl-tRNA(Asn/Gln) amidotransferase C subunit